MPVIFKLSVTFLWAVESYYSQVISQKGLPSRLIGIVVKESVNSMLQDDSDDCR